MIKITTKTTKEEMTKLLGDTYLRVKKLDKGLGERITYASKVYKKDPSKVTKADLMSLCKEVIAVLTAEETPKKVAKTPTKKVKAENLTKAEGVKKATLKKKAKEDVSEVEVETVPKKTVKKVDKKSANKTTKVKKPKESGVTVLNKDEESINEAILIAENFKETITVQVDKDTEVTYQRADDIKTMEDLTTAFENGETVVFAMYWSDRYLAQFPYFNGQFKAPKSFPLDLDLATCLYVSENGTCAYVMSIYSEGMYVIFPNDLKEFKGVRFSNGIEYQIYRQVD